MRVASVRADTVEIDVRWPRGADAERRRFRTLFGNRLVMATAFVGEQAVFAVGHDVRGRLAAMVDAASGRASPSLANDPRFRNALGFHSDSRVSLSWLSTAGMADFIGRTLRENGLLGPGQLDALGPVLVDAGDGAIVTTTNARGLRYELSTRLPTSSLPGLPRIGAILWRIALSPLLNPPTMPPLPIPPAHVTPSGGEPAAPVRPRRNASSNSNQLL